MGDVTSLQQHGMADGTHPEFHWRTARVSLNLVYPSHVGLPGRHIQAGTGGWPTDKSMYLWSTMFAGPSLSSQAMCPKQRYNGLPAIKTILSLSTGFNETNITTTVLVHHTVRGENIYMTQWQLSLWSCKDFQSNTTALFTDSLPILMVMQCQITDGRTVNANIMYSD